MEPILLVHGYSSEGVDIAAKQIYGDLPQQLKKALKTEKVQELNLSRWISLENGISIDDVSFAMERALRQEYPHLLEQGFHLIVHSTGALVVRNWIRQHSSKPSPVKNLIYLAGAHFGSGLAHIGKGQLSRWSRFIFTGTEPGLQILDELEFGSWKTLDLHRHFLTHGQRMRVDYEIQEFCLAGSQVGCGTLKQVLSIIPIRYVKEDSSDNTVRTSAANLNFNYIPVTPTAEAFQLSARQIRTRLQQREKDKTLSDKYYAYQIESSTDEDTEIPFALLYKTAHFGNDIGIINGDKNRRSVVPHIKTALKTRFDTASYAKTRDRFHAATEKTLSKVKESKRRILPFWNKQQQYEGHSQIIFRIRDQFNNPVAHHDITFRSHPEDEDQAQLERMIEDKHNNKKHPGTLTFYLRTVKYYRGRWNDLICNIAPIDFEITAYEPETDDISYVPVNIRLTTEEICRLMHNFRTTIIDITLLRLPSDQVFHITPSH